MSKGQWRTRPRDIALNIKHVRQAVEASGLTVEAIDVDLLPDRTRISVRTGKAGDGASNGARDETPEDLRKLI